MLSAEPGAGTAWRSRWNLILGRVETALSGTAGRALAGQVVALERVAEAARVYEAGRAEDLAGVAANIGCSSRIRVLRDALAALDAAT